MASGYWEVGGGRLLDDDRAAREGDAALAIVRNDKGEILCVSRPEPPHELAIPGGLVEPGESPGFAAIRELREECGIEITWARPLRVVRSPSDGRRVHIFVAEEWRGTARAAEEGTRIGWLTPHALLAQSVVYRATVADLLGSGDLYPVSAPLADAVRMDLSPSDVHVPSAGRFKRARTPTMSITAQKRKDLPLDKFAWPEKRKYPIDTAARVRAAASYLVKEHNAGMVPDAVFSKAKARIRAAAKRFGIKSELKDALAMAVPTRGGRKGIAVRAQLGPGGHLHVRTMSQLAGGKLVCLPTIAMGDPVALADKSKPVWIQLAKVGTFKGHPAGEFELNPSVFDEIVRNFKATENGRIPVDFEHASEAAATDGSVPVLGAPAQGWIVDMSNKGADGLWGLVEWLEPAREYIRSGQYKFFSPAIRFNARDRVTGKPIGARMTSGALTNQPFLDGMAPLVARDFDTLTSVDTAGTSWLVAASENGPRVRVYEDVPELITLDGKSALAHQPGEYMPAIRRSLSMHPLASAAECCMRLDDLRDHLDAVDGDPSKTHEGVDLSYPCSQLRDLVGARPGDTWDDVFEIVEALIRAAMDDDGDADPDHDGDIDAPMDDADGDGDDGGDGGGVAPDMNDQPAAGAATAAAAAARDKATMDQDKLLKDAEGKVTTLSAENATLKTDNATLTLRVKELEGQAEKDAKELKTLREAAAMRAEADLVARVNEAFETYKDKKNLSEEDKETMTIVLRANAEKFEKAYPRVAKSEQHLMADLTGKGDGPRQPSADPAPAPGAKAQKVSLRSVAKRIAAQRGISLDAAQRVAESIAKRSTNPEAH